MTCHETVKCNCCGFLNPVGGLVGGWTWSSGEKGGTCSLCSQLMSTVKNEYWIPNQDLFQVMAVVGNQIRRDLAEIEERLRKEIIDNGN